MRIHHIYITKEGEPMANPEMEYPTLYFISGGHEVARTDLDEALAKYHSGLLPFEDKQEVEMRFCEARKYCECGTVCMSTKMPQPDTLIPVELEVEVVEVCQIACQSPCDSYNDTGHCKNPKIFLRIKPLSHDSNK